MQRHMETNETAKHYRDAIGDMATEFLCPITRELPVDPVTAEDGRVYEKASIEAWLMRHPGPARSPVTNEVMGKRLLPAIQVRNTIKGMVASGAVSDSMSEAWRTRIKAEQELN